MGIINVLDISVANLIAAGEVVERPASAIKEMVENSIDAGAGQITVEIQKGGIAFMRVTDDGCGMSGEDAVISLRRHATSKIRNAEDLASIYTLGFRGEALAAITAVSGFRIMTKRRADAEGTLVSGEYGRVEEVSATGCPDGTTIICERLFATTPARLKFLKSDASEGAAVAQAMERLAVSHPEIAFRFLSDGKLKFSTSGDGKLQNAIYSVYGSAFATKLIAVSGGTGGVTVEGYISAPDNVRGNRGMQQFFINSRCVRSKTLMSALEAAFRSYIPSERFPSCVLNIKIPTALVDVNIHPAKLEVKFSSEKTVFDAVYSAVRGALVVGIARPELEFGKKIAAETEKVRTVAAFVPEDAPKPSPLETLFAAAEKRGGESEILPVNQTSDAANDRISAIKTDKPSIPVQEERRKPSPDIGFPAEDDDIPVDVPILRDPPMTQRRLGADTNLDGFEMRSRLYGAPVTETGNGVTFPVKSDEEQERTFAIKESTDAAIAGMQAHPVPEYRIVGEVFSSYVIIETEGKMILIDKHAAHERINFERLRANMKSDARNVQMLLTPETVSLSEEEAVVCTEYRSELEAVGFEFDVSEREATLCGIPQDFGVAEAKNLFHTLVKESLESGASIGVGRQAAFERALYQSSCKASVKAGRVYDMAHIRWICDNLLRYDCIKFCPHGRPVAFELSKRELDTRFGRT